MTASLLLLLRGPMQSWGDESRYVTRKTHPHPTKSGVLGLIAAAEGRRRTDSIEDLVNLRFAVRIDQPGRTLRDYQTAEIRLGTGGDKNTISYRYFLSDAVFVAAVEHPERSVLEGIESALRAPRYTLFLGRRSCPAGHDLVQGIRDTCAVSALRAEKWHASDSHRLQVGQVELPIYRDALPGESGVAQRDVPISFDGSDRRHGWRQVVREPEGVPVGEASASAIADPFFGMVMGA